MQLRKKYQYNKLDLVEVQEVKWGMGSDDKGGTYRVD
jgi:hypothetical protein